MTLTEYQREALRTASFSDDSERTLMILALGVAGEAGEVADLVKKAIGHGHGVDRELLAKELGDVLWYIAIMAAHLAFPLDDVAEMNIAKLRARYPDGFSSERSKERLDG